MPVNVQAIIEPYNDTYDVVNAKHVGVGEGENKKKLSDILNNLPSGGGDITVDSELSLESENPVQNKVIKAAFDSTNRNVSSIFQRQEEMGNHLDSLQNQVNNMGGGSGGVSSWKDLTDKPFDHEAGINREWLPSVTGTNEYNSTFGAFILTQLADEETYQAFLENVKPITVIYDGVEFTCKVRTMQGTPYIGNGVPLGAEGNGEPFAIFMMQDAGYSVWCIASTVDTTATEHTVRIYQDIPERWILKEECLPDAAQPVSIDLSGFDTNGAIVETYADGTSKTTTMEFDASGNPIKITDADGNVTTLTW